MLKLSQQTNKESHSVVCTIPKWKSTCVHPVAGMFEPILFLFFSYRRIYKKCAKKHNRRTWFKQVRRLTLCMVLTFSLCFFTAAERPYRYNPQSDVIRCFPTQEKYVALTFDDGPHPRNTPLILDILKENDAHATFFTIGVNVTYYPDLVCRALSEGHEIGNHTFSHPELLNASKQTVLSEICDASNAVKNACGETPIYFRPPQGRCRDEVIAAAEEAEMTIILWSIDTRDWAGNSVEHIVEEVMNVVQPGDIILFHDYASGADYVTPEALRVLLPQLRAAGYEMVTVSKLLGREDS